MNITTYQHQGAVVVPATTTTVQQPVIRRRPWKAFIGVGIAECVIGAILIILDIVALTSIYTVVATLVSSGIWGGLILSANGAASIYVGAKKKKDLITLVIGCSTGTAVALFIVMIIQSVAAGSMVWSSFFGLSTAYYCHIVNSLLATAAWIMAIVHASISCCCASGQNVSTATTTHVVTTTTVPTQHYAVPPQAGGYSNVGYEKPPAY